MHGIPRDPHAGKVVNTSGKNKKETPFVKRTRRYGENTDRFPTQSNMGAVAFSREEC